MPPPAYGSRSKDRMYEFHTVYGRKHHQSSLAANLQSSSTPTERNHSSLFQRPSHPHHRSINIPEPSSPRIPLHNTLLPTARHRLLFRPLQLLVLPLVHIPQHERQADYRQTNRGVGAAAGDVPGPIAAGVHVGAVDRSGVRDAISYGDGAGALDEGAREGVGDPGDDDLVGRYGAHGHLWVECQFVVHDLKEV